MNLKIPIVLAVFFSVFIIPNSFAYTYNVDYFQSATGKPANFTTPSFYSSNADSCDIELNTRATLTATGTHNMIVEFFSPADTLIGTGTLENMNGNQNCRNFGKVETDETYATGTYEARTTTTFTATSGLSVLRANLTCTETSDYLKIQTRYPNGSYVYDSEGYFPHIYGKDIGGSELSSCSKDIDQYIQQAVNSLSKVSGGQTYGFCYDLNGTGNVVTGKRSQTYSGSQQRFLFLFNYVVFNSSEVGRVSINVNGSSWSAPTGTLCETETGYYKISDNTSYVKLCTQATCNANLTLESDELYALVVSGYSSGWLVTSLSWYPDIEINVMVYEPDWDCTEWTDCEGGLQSRTCIDPLGKVPDRIEYRSCFDVPFFELNLGFEEFYTQSGIKKCVETGANILGFINTCGWTVETVGRAYPVGWNVPNPNLRDFIGMSDDTATEGSRSLLMWYLPPTYLPTLTSNLTLCNISNAGEFPQILRGINDSLFISYNVTFPSPYMTISYDVKRCATPVEQSNNGWCSGRVCYDNAGQCNLTPKGRYLFRLLDTNTSTVLVDVFEEAPEQWTSNLVDVSESGIIPNRTYNIVFALNPFDQYEGRSHCIYLDNVNVQLRDSELVCEQSFCIGLDLYVPKVVNGTCVYEIRPINPTCVPEEAREDVENRENFCIGTTGYEWNNETLDYEIINNSAYCVSLIEEETGIYAPIQSIDDTVNGSALEEAGFGFVRGFYSPIFISLLLALIIPLLLIYLVGKTVALGDSAGTIFTISFLGVLSVMTMLGMFPIVILILLGIVSAVYVANFVVGKLKGG